MSTKSRARALRRHPELTQEREALGAIGASLIDLVTLGMLSSDPDVPPSSRAPATARPE
ncbi:MAG: hypothetical protein U0270_30090 [Labilithrix sp.]